MKVKVTKATHDTYWYAKHIGEVFEVERYRDDEFIVLPTNPEGDYFIGIEDCEIVEESPTR